MRQYFHEFWYCISCHENIQLENLFMMTLYRYFKPTKPSSRSQVWLSKCYLPFHYPQLFPCPLPSGSLPSLLSPPCTKSTERYRLSSVTWHKIAPLFLKTGARCSYLLRKVANSYAWFHYFNCIRIVYISLLTWGLKDFMVSGSPGTFIGMKASYARSKSKFIRNTRATGT